MVMGQDDMAQPSGSYKKSPPVAARATFSCVKFSHPFQNRSLVLEPNTPVKIGRSGPHVGCAPNNAIFDCVVISRDHASVWFEDGRFYLQDTRSSNGTFVNNELIGEKAKESPPMLVYNGDVVQFGSAVFSPDMKSRLGSIIATLRLYLPDGSEAPCRPPSVATSAQAVPAAQLYQLAAYLQEAEHREQKLRKKLGILQHVVETTWKAVGEAWRALVTEDLLASKVDLLQRRFDAIVKESPDDRLRQEMVNLNEALALLSESSKKQLEKGLQDRSDDTRARDELERCRDNLESECAFYKTIAQQSQDDLKDLGQKYTLYFEKYQAVSQRADADRHLQERCRVLEQEKRQLKEFADKAVAEKEMLEKCMMAFQNGSALSPSKHADLLMVDVLEGKAADPGNAIKPKFSVTLVNQGLELVENVASKLESNDQEQSRLDSLFKRFERIERVENIRVEKMRNIRLQLENLKAGNKSSDGLQMVLSLKEYIDGMENELSLLIPVNNRSSKMDLAAVDSTKYANEVINSLKADNTRLTVQLNEAEDSLRYLEAKRDLYQMDFKTLTLKSMEAAHENKELKKKLGVAHAEITTKNNTIFELKKKAFLLEKSSKEDLQHVAILQTNLGEQQVQNDRLQRDCDARTEELARLQDALRQSRDACAQLEASAAATTSEASALRETCERLRAECARNEAGKKTYQAAQDDFIVLNQKLFEQVRVIEQMQTDLADVERERENAAWLARELADARRENADLEARVDPTVGYFLPLVVAMVFVFAVVLFSQSHPLEPRTQDPTR